MIKIGSHDWIIDDSDIKYVMNGEICDEILMNYEWNDQWSMMFVDHLLCQCPIRLFLL